MIEVKKGETFYNQKDDIRAWAADHEKDAIERKLKEVDDKESKIIESLYNKHYIKQTEYSRAQISEGGDEEEQEDPEKTGELDDQFDGRDIKYIQYVPTEMGKNHYNIDAAMKTLFEKNQEHYNDNQFDGYQYHTTCQSSLEKIEANAANHSPKIGPHYRHCT